MSGRGSAEWEQLRRLALEAADGVCQLRLHGCTFWATTVHLDPELANDHSAATVDDLTACCASCHGRLDGPRSWPAA